MKTVAAYTLGCKVNQYDTQAMCELLEHGGYRIVPFSRKADVYIINTCTVTAMADKKSRQIVSRAVKKNPGAVVCVCGCLAQKESERILNIPGVSCVVGNSGRSNICGIINDACEKKTNCVKAIGRDFENLEISTPGERTRANIKVQEGCDNYCAYCIIPYVRGHERSRNFDSIIEEGRRLSESGVSELVLTGIHVSSYLYEGKDLADIAVALSSVDGIKRIRLGSLEQPALTEAFIEKLSRAEKLCPHFHISLQSGSDRVLKLMNRKYTSGEYFSTAGMLRKYFDNPAITTDIITGFPGESDEDFEITCDFVSAVEFSRLHVFPYSEREGTKACTLDGKVPVHVRRERANILIDLGKKTAEKYMSGFLGKREEVLFEQNTSGSRCSGYTTRYIPVESDARPGEYRTVLMDTLENGIIIGK